MTGLLSVTVNKFGTKNSIPMECIRVGPENQRKAPPTQIFHFWGFRFYDILTFEYKFDRMHIAMTMLQFFRCAALVHVWASSVHL